MLYRLLTPKCMSKLKFGMRYYQKTSSIPELASDRYNVTRGQYNVLTDADVAHFESVLGKNKVITDSDEVNNCNIDFLRTVRGCSRLLLKPTNTEEISLILKHCNSKKLAVCPQSGNTGLVGGSVPIFDEIVISLQSLNKIEQIDEVSGILTCQSGCVLETLEEKLQEKGLCMPLDLGAKGSCLIGGNVSTNAGGLRLLRYGNLHGSVLGVEVVKADGEILDLMSHFKKDNTGYHLKHLFIGSEGTLGIVTKVAMFCPTAGKAVNVAFLGLNGYEDVKKLFIGAKQDLGEILSSVELIDADSLQCSVGKFNLTCPIENFPFYMLIETTGSNSQHDEEKIETFLTKYMENGVIQDGTVTNEPHKIKEIWKLRELIPIGIVKDDYCFKYDISLPISHFYDIVTVMKEQVGSLATRVCGYGHFGDSNLHLNIACKEYNTEIHSKIEPFVFEYTAKVKGSISAEHGIGFLKPKYLKFSKSPEALLLMKDIKELMDPNRILNPYKVLPSLS